MSACDWRDFVRDSAVVWLSVEDKIKTLRRPRDEQVLDDTGAANALGIDANTLLSNRTRLKLPRLSRDRWSALELEAWRRANDFFREL